MGDDHKLRDDCKVRFNGIAGAFEIAADERKTLFNRQWWWVGILITVAIAASASMWRVTESRVSNSVFERHCQDNQKLEDAYQETRDALNRIEGQLQHLLDAQ